jgi:hypothetical protein
MRRPLVATLAATLAFSTSALAQTANGVAFSSIGQLSTPKQQDRVAFEVTPEKFGLTGDARIGLVFVLSADGDSLLDPGLIKVAATGGTVEVGGTRRPDTGGSRSSLALATLAAGTYDVWVQSERNTTGAYRLDVRLAGDANGDLRVDDADVLLIDQLTPQRVGEATYSALADVDRNGVINGGDRQRAIGNFGASAQAPQAENPLDQPLLDPGALSLLEGSTSTFNRRSGPLQFSLVGADFSLDPTEVVLTINGVPVPTSSLAITDHLLSANTPLADGKNVVSLKAYDTVGRPLYFTGTLWAGAATLRVNLVNPNGTPFLQETTIVVSLSDDPAVVARITTVGGTALFPFMPARTVLVKAQGLGNETGTAGVIGTQGTVQVTMLGFGAPSPIANNDFSQGTAGWSIGSAPLSIVPHLETIPGFPAAAGPAAAELNLLAAASIVDQDLQLSTGGEGEQSISRSFTTQQGTTGVRIRYRFITTEVPGGYFGSQFNDYFRVSLRSQQGGGAQQEQASMNGLGLGAFDFASGSTNWREFTLPVDRDGDTIQADIAVANVGDGLFPSYVIVDFVEELREEVRPRLSWNNTAGGLNLTYEVLEDLTAPVVIDVHWASGTSYANRIGAAVFSHTVPAGTPAGTYGPVAVAGNLLAGDPANVTHLLAASSPTMVGAVPDVQLGYGANANQAVVSAAMIDIVRDGQRAAGQASATITSTSRTPDDQARAMFQNLTNPNRTIAQNVQNQLALYGAAGDRVINVFVAETTGLTRDQIIANSAAIRAAMSADITANIQAWQGGHLADPNVRVVVDVGAAVFNAQNGPLFVASVSPRVATFFDERTTNGCYHLEIPR